MLQLSQERETLQYLQPCSAPRSCLKNNVCHLPDGFGAKVIAMQDTIIRARQHAEESWQFLFSAAFSPLPEQCCEGNNIKYVKAVAQHDLHILICNKLYVIIFSCIHPQKQVKKDE